ncbi:MAG: hypothetical protein J3K34DRAFT_503931 [Monoraphidium minutum]|nr:MAG: hypothetical protein J3K34DRAFT_503931 [Monoraphidium minutum]
MQQLEGELARLGLGERPLGHSSGPSHSNLYVNNLPHDATEEQVEALFSSYGDVLSTRLVQASRLGASTKTFAFVKFGTVQQAMAAIRALNQTPCGGLGLLEVKFADADAGDRNPELSAPPSDNLYVKNLPGSFSDDDVRALFAPFGGVAESKLLHQGDTTQARDLRPGAPARRAPPPAPRYAPGAGALVRLQSVEAARAAIASLHNDRLPGGAAPLVVRFADSAEQKAKKAARMGRAYDRWAAALGHGSSAGSAELRGCVSSGGSDAGGAGPGPGRGGEREHGGLGGGLGFAGVRERESSVYVKYLPETADRLFLYERFAPFGAVHSVKATGLCKGVGFVNYLEAEAALRAVRGMNNIVVGSKRLHVAVQVARDGARGGGGGGPPRAPAAAAAAAAAAAQQHLQQQQQHPQLHPRMPR